MDAAGNLYGTTVQNSDDHQPHRLVMDAAGSLYSTPASGGSGTVFELIHN